jgi:hypothetical protein
MDIELHIVCPKCNYNVQVKATHDSIMGIRTLFCNRCDNAFGWQYMQGQPMHVLIMRNSFHSKEAYGI